MTTRENQTWRHPPLGLLQSYAVGALGPATSAAIAIHAQHCAVCADRIVDLDALGGALFEADAPAAFDVETSLQAVMAQLDVRAPQLTPYSPDVMALPEPLRASAAEALDHGRWAYAAPGLRTLDLQFQGSKAFAERPQLLRIEPGFGAPLHSHGAMELTLVLEGAFRDETGLYGPGDLAVATDSLTHRPIAEPGRVCLAYAVSHAPMRFTGMLGFVQRLLTPRQQ